MSNPRIATAQGSKTLASAPRGGKSAYFLIIVVAVLLTSAGLLALRKLGEERDRTMELLRTSSWHVVQAEIEIVRLSEKASTLQYGGPVEPEDVRRQLDIFWSRIPLLLGSEETRILDRVGGREVARRIMDDLPRLEQAVARLPFADEADFRRLRQELEDIRVALHGITVGLLAQDQVAGKRDRIARTYAQVTASLGVVLFIAIGLLLLLLRQLRATESLVRISREAERRANEANRAKSRFLAAASHDLRQPLNALGLLLGLLETRVTDPVALELVGKGRQSLGRVTEQINTYLDLSRIDSGNVVVEESEIPLADLFRKVMDLVSGEAAAKGIRLRVAHTEAVAFSDPKLLERILFNLAANAVRYTERGTVLIGCRRRGGTLRIDVIDTGPGIAEEHRETIFDEFYQIGNRERSHEKGLGLGLSIVKRLANQLGHPVEVASIPGRGSRFSVTVPDIRRAASTSPVAVAPIAAITVMIIEDDVLVAGVVKATLEDSGCRVFGAASAEEAFEVARGMSGGPNLIIADYRLPGRTGIEAVSALRQYFGAEIPAWIVTADRSPSIREEARALKVRFLQKPVSVEDLRAMVAEGRRQARGIPALSIP